MLCEVLVPSSSLVKPARPLCPCRSPASAFLLMACALALLANFTDICEVFIKNCHMLAGCTSPAQPLIRKLQATYGAFRELHDGHNLIEERLKIVARSRDGRRHSFARQQDHRLEPSAVLSRTQGCRRRIDLVLVRRGQQPILAQLAALLSRAPERVCVRSLVVEVGAGHRRTLGAADADTGVSLDVRDRLLGVTRLKASLGGDGHASLLHPSSRESTRVLWGAIQAHRSWEAVNGQLTSESVYVRQRLSRDAESGLEASSSRLLCLARMVFRQPSEGNGSLLRLDGGWSTLHLSAPQLAGASLAWLFDLSARIWSSECEKRAEGSALTKRGLMPPAEAHQRRVSLRRGLSRLVLEVEHMMHVWQPMPSAAAHTRREGGSTGTPPGCLEPDYLHFHRELLYDQAAEATRVCDRSDADLYHSRGVLVHSPALLFLSARAAGTHGSKRLTEELRDTLRAQPKLSNASTDPNACLAPTLHPSGFFSMVHGLVKPLIEALETRRGITSPLARLYTSPACATRDLRCFFQPLSPKCDAAVNPIRIASRGPVTARRSRQEQGLPSRYERLGWSWWISQLLAHVMRPSAAIEAQVVAELQTSGLAAALQEGTRVVGVHVRQGDRPTSDVCSAMESQRTRRSCSPLRDYMREVARLDPAARTIYLCTDSEDIIKQAKEYSSYRFLYSTHVQRSTSSRPPALWDTRVWAFYKWGKTDWTHGQAVDAIVDMLLLSRAHSFVGKFSSNFFRAAYSVHNAACDCIAPFISLDAPWCFDFGVEEGKNWEFPLINTSGSGGLAGSKSGSPMSVWEDRGTPVVRLASFQC